MQIIDSPRLTLLSRPSFFNPDHFPFKPDNNGAQDLVEFSARLCYLSFGKGQIDGHKTVEGRKSREDYFTNLKFQKHGSVMEHANWSILIEGVSRSLTHELVRHRAGFAYSQLSQRFVEATNVPFVRPLAVQYDTPEFDDWKKACESSERSFQTMLRLLELRYGRVSPKRIREASRSVLPNCAETKIVVTGNARAWRHFLTKRGALGADAEIRRLALRVLLTMRAEAPLLFSDFNEVRDPDLKETYIKVEYENV